MLLSLSLSLSLCVDARFFTYFNALTSSSLSFVRSHPARRQELVSMIPVKLLDVQPHHLVLDSCASPGSKTSQILEVMLSKSASGAVVANDASLQRANLLTHRCYRLEAAAKNLLVIHHDAQTLPLELENTFDRILCDVPCSGDGTLRKSTDLWKKWSNSSGAELHPIQVNVATRALRLLKHGEDGGGGRLVYSTCSLNPLENEAVVAELLERSRGAIRLVDCSKILPDLKRLPGLTKWSVQDLKTMTWYDTYDSYLQDNRGSRQHSKIKKSMFAKSNNHKHNLDRCFRIHPDLNDTGGFFVAVFEKVKPLPAEMIEIDSKEEQKLSRTTNINTKKWASAKIAPVFSVNDTNADFKAVMKRIKAKYGFDVRKKEENGGMELVTRNNSDVVPKRLYCLSKGAKSILDKCNDRKNQHHQQKLRVLACGLCCFERQAVKKESQSKSEENDCEFRFTQSGCELFQDSISKQVVRLSPKELESMLARQQQKQQTTASNKSNAPLCIDDKTKKKVLSECERGCVILAVRGKSSGSGNKRKLVEEEIAAVSPVTIACWFPPPKKNRSGDDDGNEEEDVTLTLMCSKSEGEVRLERLREHLKLKLLN
jgi:16S rRNA C967 or C1407 C5-methylase (RsmB/RsmF family)